jgi:hypothetical protein
VRTKDPDDEKRLSLTVQIRVPAPADHTRTQKKGKQVVSLLSPRIEEDEGYRECTKDDNVHPVARWETFQDQAIQHGKNTQNGPDQDRKDASAERPVREGPRSNNRRDPQNNCL